MDSVTQKNILSPLVGSIWPLAASNFKKSHFLSKNLPPKCGLWGKEWGRYLKKWETQRPPTWAALIDILFSMAASSGSITSHMFLRLHLASGGLRFQKCPTFFLGYEHSSKYEVLAKEWVWYFKKWKYPLHQLKCPLFSNSEVIIDVLLLIFILICYPFLSSSSSFVPSFSPFYPPPHLSSGFIVHGVPMVRWRTWLVVPRRSLWRILSHCSQYLIGLNKSDD